MDTRFQARLTSEQLAAIAASGGFAQCEDPTNHVVYNLIQFELPGVDDEYVRQKIEEAYVDAAENGVEQLDIKAIKAEITASFG
jgi:hypothetical protein